MTRKTRNRGIWGEEMVPVSRCVYVKAWPFFSSLIFSLIDHMRNSVCVSLEVGKGGAECISEVPMRNLRSGGKKKKRQKSMSSCVSDFYC